MRNRRSQLDMTHALAADNGASYFNATFFTNNSLVANAAVFAAITLVVTVWTKDALVEETALFRTLGAVVDGFRLGDLAVGPFENLVG